ncbi:MAG: hypothetical protein PHV55_09230 [Candidatus Omnitrophica bacterium]|nr:hypothetical protein [Candidatus Omnitrophota bacterium]
MPSNYPSISFNEKGICNFCTAQNSPEAAKAAKEALYNDFQHTIANARGQGREYDCLISLSGGKDSAYLAYLLSKEYKLKVLAFTITTGFESAVAQNNIRRTIEKLDIDHYIFTPHESFFIKLYSYLFRHINACGSVATVCFICGPILYGFSLKTAVELDIPLVFHGFGPGQPPHTHHFYEMSLPHLMGDGSATGSQIYDIFKDGIFDERDRALLWNYEIYKHKKLPRVLMPLHVLEYHEDAIIKKVQDLGLIAKGKAHPLVTNCLLNWPMVYLHAKKLGFNPYVEFFSEMIRAGQAHRAYWLWMDRILGFLVKIGIFRLQGVRPVLKRLGLNEKEILARHWQ